jgi:hypothetical protein
MASTPPRARTTASEMRAALNAVSVSSTASSLSPTGRITPISAFTLPEALASSRNNTCFTLENLRLVPTQHKPGPNRAKIPYPAEHPMSARPLSLTVLKGEA